MDSFLLAHHREDILILQLIHEGEELVRRYSQVVHETLAVVAHSDRVHARGRRLRAFVNHGARPRRRNRYLLLCFFGRCSVGLHLQPFRHRQRQRFQAVTLGLHRQLLAEGLEVH